MNVAREVCQVQCSNGNSNGNTDHINRTLALGIVVINADGIKFSRK